jgi:hypothetical protein
MPVYLPAAIEETNEASPASTRPQKKASAATAAMQQLACQRTRQHGRATMFLGFQFPGGEDRDSLSVAK